MSLTSNATEAGIGQEVNITVTLDGTPCPALNLSNALLDGKVGTPADVAMITRLREVSRDTPSKSEFNSIGVLAELVGTMPQTF